MAGWAILNAMLSCGNKLCNFENSSKTYDIVGRNLLETLCVMLIVINFKGAGADLGKERRGEWGGGWIGCVATGTEGGLGG